ncbi:MAG: hypothetical protein DI538_28150 [Azospira oryzae]|nr:MAG: hypothetical protein DI538_28150 [Azospira oryzae]
MDKAKDHHHQGGHHQTGTVQNHHHQTPVKCETGNGGDGDYPGTVGTGGTNRTVSFQANNNLDIFQVLEVREDDVELSDETLINVKDLQFDSDKPWVTGNVPQMIPVNVEGDTIMIYALLKVDRFDKAYTLRIYVEYEESETLITEPEEVNTEGDCILKPQEIHL